METHNTNTLSITPECPPMARVLTALGGGHRVLHGLAHPCRASTRTGISNPRNGVDGGATGMNVLQERYEQPGEILITIFILTITHQGEYHGKESFFG